MKQILKCTKCNLCNNQSPLLDKALNKCDVMWVGLSSKKIKDPEETPLYKNTNSGKIIQDIENGVDHSFYKTNLVKCLPLNDKNKLRYPFKDEMENCYENLLLEIKTLNPSIVFLLGKQVSNFIFMKQKEDQSFQKIEDGWYYQYVRYIEIQHPSYIYVYQKKQMKEYISKIQEKVLNLKDLP